MSQLAQPENFDYLRPRSQRSSSISSDRASLSVASLAIPPTVSPDPAYIAPVSASQIVTGDREPTLRGEDDEGDIAPGASNIAVAPNALYLVNAFLDQLLYSFLASSRSTSIAALRPAVTEVLKPRIAKDAIASADEELKEFLGAEDDEQLEVFHYSVENKGDWHLNTIWRRTRLRCMVYTRLGDLEEEDEEMYIQQENAEHQAAGHHRLSRDLGVVSPAAAIFLTSIIEFVGEQVLLISADSAYTRSEVRRRQEKQNAANSLEPHSPSVEVVDIEKLALNKTFGRLWRSWKKRVRAPSMTSPSPSSLDQLLPPSSSHSTSAGTRSRHASIGDVGESDFRPAALQVLPKQEDLQRRREASAVPLSAWRDGALENRDPGFATQESHQDPTGRPRSMMIPASGPGHFEGQANGTAVASSSRPGLLQHNRSSSLPQLSYAYSPSSHESLFSTPKEGQFPAALGSSPSGHSRFDSGRAVVTTMYDGTIGEGATGGGQGVEEQHPDFFEQDRSRKEMQDLDGGLDSVAEVSQPSQVVNVEAPADMANYRGSVMRDQHFSQGPAAIHVSPALSHAAGPSIESRLDSPRMQGFTAENVSHDNRETSLVEAALHDSKYEYTSTSQASGYQGAERADAPIDEREHLPACITDPASYVSQGQLDGAALSTVVGSRAQERDFAPKSQPDAFAEKDVAYQTSPFTFPQVKSPIKVSDIRKQLPPVSTGVDRASVQRVSPSPGSALESPTARTSTSSSRDVRPIYTSGSSTSQRAAKPKGLLGRESSDTSRPFGASRASSESSVNKGNSGANVDERQRNFEQLIKSDETIQYTLTPQSVRESDSPESPRASHSRTATADLADFIRTSGPETAETTRPAAARSRVSLKGFNGLRSSPSTSSKPLSTATSAPILEKPNSMHSQRSRPTTARSAHGAPRDAQLHGETTRDFADFIRSTGPDKSSASNITVKAMLPPPENLRPNRAVTPNQRSTSATSTGKKITKPNPSLSKSPPPVVQSPPPQRATMKLQAREAKYEPTHNEDLLDFLKQGPADGRNNERRSVPGPLASVVPQNPRVPNNVRGGNTEPYRSSVASTQDSSFADRSIRSTNSRTGLLDSPRGTHAHSPPTSQRNRFDDQAQQPARKQRRVRDPYAIDTDSEDEDRPGTPKPQRHEESLIDFLNSTPPPNGSSRIPSAFDGLPDLSIRNNFQVNGNKSRNPYAQRHAAPTSATPGIRSANAQLPSSTPQRQPQQQQQKQPQQQPPRGRSNQPPQLPPLNSRDISPTLTSNDNQPSNMPQRSSSLASTNGTTLPPLSSPYNYQPATNKNALAANNSSKSKPMKPRGMPRSERETNNRGMADLADFLRNSEPPTQVPAEFRGEGEEKETSGGKGGGGVWGRIKGRRRGK